MSDVLGFVLGFSDRRDGDDPAHPPFFDSLEGRLRKNAPAGCAYATAGFPPTYCDTRPLYVAQLHDDYTDRPIGGTWWFCPEHAERARTLTFGYRVTEMRILA